MYSATESIATDFSTPFAGARTMASRGHKVFPLKPNTKLPFSVKEGDDPALCGGINVATTDPAKFEAWFTRDPGINYGVSTDGHAVLDVDPRNDDDGWVAEYMSLGPIPETLQTITPSGGMHLYFGGFEAGQRKLSNCIDVRGRGGYVVGPGSVIDGRRYRVHVDAPLAPVPAAIAARLSKPGKGAESKPTEPLCEPDTAAAMAAAWALVARTKPAVEGERNRTAHTLAGRLKRLGVSEEICLQMVLHWNASNLPPSPEDELAKTVASSYANGDWRIGEDRPDGEFDNLSADPDLNEWEARPAKGKVGPASEPTGKLTLLEHFSDVRLEEIVARETNALVKHILYRGDAAVSYGESTAGKTFGVLDLSWHLALGKPEWHGRKLTKAPVLYVALEGVDGFRKRMLAAGQVHGDPGVWFARLTIPISLVKAPKKGEAGVAKIVEAAKALAAKCGQPVGLIVVDTVARAIAGDSQNDSETVMAFVDQRMGTIQKATGAAVMAVHHTNRGGDIRGSLDWRNPMDCVLHWKRGKGLNDDTVRFCIGDKVKDGDDGVVLFKYDLEVVQLGEDADGDAITSCVVRETKAMLADAQPKKAAKPATKTEQLFREAFDAVREDSPINLAPLSDVRDYYLAHYPAKGERDPKTVAAAARQAWKRAVEKLPKKMTIYECEGKEYVRDKGARTDPLVEFEAFDVDFKSLH